METDVTYRKAREHSLKRFIGMDLSLARKRNLCAFTLACMISLILSSPSPWFLAGGILASLLLFIYYCIVDWKTTNLMVANCMGPSDSDFESSIDEDEIRETCIFPKKSEQEKPGRTYGCITWEAVSQFYYDKDCCIVTATTLDVIICVDSRLISLDLRKKIQDRLLARGVRFADLEGTVQHLKKKHKRFFVEVVLLWLFFIFWGSFVYYLNSLLE